MSTTFDDWLRQLAAAGKLARSGIAIDRGLPFAWTFALGGDWTGATIASSLRLAPDAEGDAVEDFTCPNDGYSADLDATEFTLALTALQTAALTADDDGDGLATLAWDVLFTPSGGDEMRLFGGPATIAGKVTDG
jgi:hypothetical protein